MMAGSWRPRKRLQLLALVCGILACSCDVQGRSSTDPTTAAGSQSAGTPTGLSSKPTGAEDGKAAASAAKTGDAAAADHAGHAGLVTSHSDVIDTFYFGRHSEHGTVTLEQWDDFLQQEVTPRFPQGLITWQASLQRRNDHNDKDPIDVVPTLVLQLIHQNSTANTQAIDAIAAAYKQRFDQTSVLLVHQTATVSY